MAHQPCRWIVSESLLWWPCRSAGQEGGPLFSVWCLLSVLGFTSLVLSAEFWLWCVCVWVYRASVGVTRSGWGRVGSWKGTRRQWASTGSKCGRLLWRKAVNSPNPSMAQWGVVCFAYFCVSTSLLPTLILGRSRCSCGSYVPSSRIERRCSCRRTPGRWWWSCAVGWLHTDTHMKKQAAEIYFSQQAD